MRANETSLPKGRKKRAKADGGLVSAILNKLCAAMPGAVWAWRANSGKPKVVNRDDSVGHFRAGERGTPDILGVVLAHDKKRLVTRTIFFGIECKRVGGKRNANQVIWHGKAARFHVPVATVYSISEAKEFLDGLRGAS